MPASAPSGCTTTRLVTPRRSHLGAGVGELRAGGDGVRIGDHQGLGALHPRHLGDLLLDGQEAVHDADAPGARHRDRHRVPR